MNEDDRVLLSSLCCLKFSKVVKRNQLSRAAGLYFFVLEGICIGMWSMLLPTISTNLHLTDSELGAAALCTYLGTLIATPIAACIISLIGVRHTALISTLGFCVCLPLIIAFDSYIALLITMLAFGIFWGITDVMAGNATVLAEIVGGESYMGTCYGSFSLTAGFISLTEEAIRSNLTASLICLIVTLIVCNVTFSLMVYDQNQELHILDYNRTRQAGLSQVSSTTDTTECADTINPMNISPEEGESETESVMERNSSSAEFEEPSSEDVSAPGKRQRSLTYTPLSLDEDVSVSVKQKHSPTNLTFCGSFTANCSPALLILGSVAFLATFCEACFITWIVVYYKDVLHASSPYQTAGFGCMMVAMAISRFSCDFLRSKFSTRQIVFAAAVLLCTGLWLIFAMSFVPNSIALTSLGTVFVGLGVGPLNPISFSSAGHLGNLQSSGGAVATVAACAYSGSIVSSPLVGLLADAAGSLRFGFLFVAVVVSALLPLSWLVPVLGQ